MQQTERQENRKRYRELSKHVQTVYPSVDHVLHQKTMKFMFLLSFSCLSKIRVMNMTITSIHPHKLKRITKKNKKERKKNMVWQFFTYDRSLGFKRAKDLGSDESYTNYWKMKHSTSLINILAFVIA